MFCVSPTDFTSQQDAGRRMQTLFDQLRKTSGPVLTASLFAITFVLGLAVFSISGSIAISAICMALGSVTSAMAAREIFGHPGDDRIRTITREETRNVGRRLTELAERVTDVEVEIRDKLDMRATPDYRRIETLYDDVKRISAILQDLVFIVEAQDTHLTQIKAEPHRAAALPNTAAAKLTKPSVKPANPLAAIQMENILREDILNGKLKVQLTDIAQIETGRIALRQVKCMLQGRLPEFRSDQDLIRGEISPGIIQLFDRMRFGFAYEFANQFGSQAGSAPIICPLMRATFSHTEAADEIVNVIENHNGIAQHLVLAFDHAHMLRPTPPEDERFRRLQIAGTSLAVQLQDNLLVEPEILFERGVKYVLVNSALLLGRTNATAKSEIHPSDLASYLGRYDMALIAQDVDTVADAKTLKSMGVLFADGTAIAANGTLPPALRPTIASSLSSRSATQNAGIGTSIRMNEPAAAPLRDRLRRVRIYPPDLTGTARLFSAARSVSALVWKRYVASTRVNSRSFGLHSNCVSIRCRALRHMGRVA
jgi:cyclic-di-GMP phosphodiesterase TipF (flagellum assembly factor)